MGLLYNSVDEPGAAAQAEHSQRYVVYLVKKGGAAAASCIFLIEVKKIYMVYLYTSTHSVVFHCLKSVHKTFN